MVNCSLILSVTRHCCGWSAQVDESRYRDVIDKVHLDLHARLVDAMLQKGADVGAETEQVGYAGKVLSLGLSYK